MPIGGGGGRGAPVPGLSGGGGGRPPNPLRGGSGPGRPTGGEAVEDLILPILRLDGGGGGRGPERTEDWFRPREGGLSLGGGGRCGDLCGGVEEWLLREMFLWGNRGVLWSSPTGGVGGRGGGPGRPGGSGGAPPAGERAKGDEETGEGLELTEGGGGGTSRGIAGRPPPTGAGGGGGLSSGRGGLPPGAGGNGGRLPFGTGGRGAEKLERDPIGGGGRGPCLPGGGAGGEGPEEGEGLGPAGSEGGEGPEREEGLWFGRGVFGTGGGPPRLSCLGKGRPLGSSGPLFLKLEEAPGILGGPLDPPPVPKEAAPEGRPPGGKNGARLAAESVVSLFPADLSFGIPPAKRPPSPAGAPPPPPPPPDPPPPPPALGFESSAGALRSLVTVFFNLVPLVMSDKRAFLPCCSERFRVGFSVFAKARVGGGGGPGGGGGGGAGILFSPRHAASIGRCTSV